MLGSGSNVQANWHIMIPLPRLISQRPQTPSKLKDPCLGGWGRKCFGVFFLRRTQASAVKINKTKCHFSVPSNALPCLLEDLSKLSSVRLGGLSNHFFLAPPLHPRRFCRPGVDLAQQQESPNMAALPSKRNCSSAKPCLRESSSSSYLPFSTQKAFCPR